MKKTSPETLIFALINEELTYFLFRLRFRRVDMGNGKTKEEKELSRARDLGEGCFKEDTLVNMGLK
jgi:hypothetical protein